MALNSIDTASYHMGYSRRWMSFRVTEVPFGAQDIHELGKEAEPLSQQRASRMGHIHLSVNDSRKSRQFFYQNGVRAR